MIPITMRQLVLKQLHETHSGITKTKKKARNAVYWPGMDDQIEKMISTCRTCQVNANKNQKEPLIAHTIPKRPFEKVACDIFHFKNKDYLVVADYFSKWIELKELKSKQAKDANLQLSEIFSRNGIPKIVITDNMPFNSFECKEFAKLLDFKFETSSPHYPKSNGLAERAVRICKNIMKKSNTIHDVYMALLDYRNTPTKDLSFSPSQLINSRVLRSKVPMINKKYDPQICANAINQIKSKQENMKKFITETLKDERNLC